MLNPAPHAEQKMFCPTTPRGPGARSFMCCARFDLSQAGPDKRSLAFVPIGKPLEGMENHAHQHR